MTRWCDTVEEEIPDEEDEEDDRRWLDEEEPGPELAVQIAQLFGLADVEEVIAGTPGVC